MYLQQVPGALCPSRPCCRAVPPHPESFVGWRLNYSMRQCCAEGRALGRASDASDASALSPRFTELMRRRWDLFSGGAFPDGQGGKVKGRPGAGRGGALALLGVMPRGRRCTNLGFIFNDPEYDRKENPKQKRKGYGLALFSAGSSLDPPPPFPFFFTVSFHSEKCSLV